MNSDDAIGMLTPHVIHTLTEFVRKRKIEIEATTTPDDLWKLFVDFQLFEYTEAMIRRKVFVERVATSSRDLYDVARDVCHEAGMDWTDPRTNVTYPAKKLTLQDAGAEIPCCAANAEDSTKHDVNACPKFADTEPK